MFEFFSVNDFKIFFQRDFPFGENIENDVLDVDIEKSLAGSYREINQALFSDQEFFTECLQYLTAHNLVINIRNSSSGIDGKHEGLIMSKSIASVSASLSLPDEILQTQTKSKYFQTNYGVKYYNLISPLLVGNFFTVAGATSA